MRWMEKAAKWFSSNYRKQGIVGKTVMGCGSLIILFSLCSIPLSLLSPAETVESPTAPATANDPTTESAPNPSLVVVSTSTTILHTSTPLFTDTPASTDTATATITNTPLAPNAECVPENTLQSGTVVEVLDGDTVKVLLDDDGKVYVVRYIGIDAPETSKTVEYFGANATEKNSQLVFGKKVKLMKDASEKDPNGRLLRYVFADTIFVNYELVSQGYAKFVSISPDTACDPVFQEAEQKASSAKLGLWSPPPTLVVFPTAPAGSSGGGPCNCTGPDLDCPNFSTQASAQACFNYCVSAGFGDIFNLDRDNDGQVCESLP